MKLMRGVNLGGYLSQCNHEMEHYENWIGKSDIDKIAGRGFDHVRLPVDYQVFQDDDGNTREYGYGFVERVVKWCESAGIDVIIDLHKAYGYDFNFAGDKEQNNLFGSERLQERFVSLWSDIAKRFGKYKHVAFELLNEVVENENAAPWNKLIARSVKAIREYAKDSVIIYGGICWNSASTLKLLEKPMDSNIVFTFHFYEPLLFTHQKAGWVKNMDMNRVVNYPDSMEHYRKETATLSEQGGTLNHIKAQEIGTQLIEELVSQAVDAAKNAGVQLYCGEFGVIDEAPVPDTLRWFEDVDAVFRRNGIGCAVWSYKEMNFGIVGEHYASIFANLIKLWMAK